ncbi:hypothetical protein CUMW_194010 [Citrus unshiu]|nr:hypothetical protein CUMW_194010 [Citrus unshiu]
MKLHTLCCHFYFLRGIASAEQCGRQAGGAVCCSEYGWCGNTPQHRGVNCQSQCGSFCLNTETTLDAKVIDSVLMMLPLLLPTDNYITRKKELAAFLAQTSHGPTARSIEQEAGQKQMMVYTHGDIALLKKKNPNQIIAN